MSPTGLPLDLTSFIGRRAELDQLADLLPRSRLVTLTGAGGSGKTRLALELVRTRLTPHGAEPRPWPDRRVAWTELAPLRDPDLLVPAVAVALGLGEEVRPGDVPGLVRRIGDHTLLLVLDNCEHLVDAVAATADALLRACPGLAILATSREALGVRGERAWLVPPLGLPDPAVPDGTTDASEAVSLFVERARDVVGDFDLTPDNAAAVVEICRRLDGIPLAIELAAARVRVLQPVEIVARLDDVFRLLTDDRRTTVPRHRTLRAAIDWSHDLLREPARILLRRLAVFRGGFNLDAAERVASGGGAEAAGPAATIEPADVLELVAGLADRSMLVVREQRGFARYHLLDAVRRYALERLEASGEEAETRCRHARYFLDRVEEAEPHFTRAERRVWVERLQDDMDNLRSALAWSRTGDPALHVRLVGALWWFWFSTRHWTEAARWIQDALELISGDDARSDDAAPPTLSAHDRAALRFAAGALAALQVRSADAQPLLREAAELAAEAGDHRLEAYATNYLGMTYAGEGDPRGAELSRRAESWFRDDDDLYGLRLALLLQGSAALAAGRLEEAERLNGEGVDVARRFGQDRELAVSLQNLAAVHLVQGRLDEAEALIREALTASRRDPSHYFIATGVSYLGEIEGGRGLAVEAARLFGAAESLRELVGARPFPVDARRVEALLPELRERAEPAAFEAAWAAGRSLSPETLLDELARPDEEAPAAMSGPAAVVAPATLAAVAPNGRGAAVTPGREPAGDSAATAPGHDGAVRPSAGERAAAAVGHAVGASSTPSPTPASPLVVEALGRFRVSVEGEPVDESRWPYAKPKELLVYLLLHPTGRSRDQIGEALWPEASRSNVKNSFHVTLHHLRKALGHPEWVGVEGERYRLDPELRPWLDADAFEAEGRRALASGDADLIRAALELHRGELLEGVPVGRWADDHRDRLRRLHVDLGLALGSLLEATDPRAAADLYRALAAREELDEEVHRRLMALLATTGDRAAALRCYSRLSDLLSSALDAEPEEETRALYESLRAGG